MLYFQISQKSNNQEFKEKGSINVTPYLDKSDGGTGYSPPLLPNNQLLIAILATIIILFLVVSKLRAVVGKITFSKFLRFDWKFGKLKVAQNQSLFSKFLRFDWKSGKLKVAQNQSLFSKFLRFDWKSGKLKVGKNQSLTEESDSQKNKTRGADEKD